MADLERVLKEKRDQFDNVLIITDGVFSMDGDIAKLPEIVKLAKAYRAMTYVDDAHGSGVLGRSGRGTVDHFNLHGQVDFIIGTLSKAIGVVGGYVCGSKASKEWLLHRGRPLLFSTAMMPSAAAAIIEAFNMLEETTEFTDRLWDNAKYFKQALVQKGFDIGHSETPITPIMVGDEAKTMAFSKELLRRGVYVSGIVFPTVPKGKGRIRCMVSALHTKEMLQKAVDIIFETAKDMAIL
jgi:glycine C-acetyltransferase